MRKRNSTMSVDRPAFVRVDYATSYFSISRYTLDKMALKIGAKKKIGKTAIYNLQMLEDVINNNEFEDLEDESE